MSSSNDSESGEEVIKKERKSCELREAEAQFYRKS
jgi:hypothetical protein